MPNLYKAKVNITQIASIYTERQFANLCLKDKSYLEKEYVYLSSIQVRGEICGGVITGNLPSNSIAIVPTTCSAYYLSFLLTSMPCQWVLFDGKINIKAEVKITKKLVSTLTLFIVSQDSQDAYGLAEKFKLASYEVYKQNRADLKAHYLYNIISDLCNTMALELYVCPMFENVDIHILHHWKSIINNYNNSDDYSEFLKELINSESEIRNQIMRVHVLEDTFKKSDDNGMENK